MSWRTIVITQRCKLDLKMGYMVVRGEDTKKIFLDEIAVLMIENTAVSLTACLLEALVNKKIKVIFCDAKRNPHAELIPIYGSYDSTRKVRGQIKWTDDVKASVWTEIVSEKIRNQCSFLKEIGKTDASILLEEYLSELEFNDLTNREGHAAKVYFNAVFGMDFTRSFDCVVNSALNYGYSILLSIFNREIVASGYLTQLGIFHDNTFNYFNLSCDMMEPFRIAVDKFVYSAEYKKFESEEKHDILSLLSNKYIIDNTQQTLMNAIKIYTKSVFDAIENKDVSLIKFPRI